MTTTFSANSIPLEGLSSFAGVPWLIAAFFLLNLIVIFVLAVAVKNDAELKGAHSELFLVGPWLWFFIVLLTGGYLPTLAYWLIHYSSLRARN